MSDNNARVLELYSNPNAVQSQILKEMEDKLGGGKVITTPNNVCSFLIESFTNSSANIIQDMLQSLEETSFPNRAQSAEALFKHLSDYDYIGLFATPCETELEFVMNMDSLKAITTPEDTSVFINIPRNSEFIIGKYIFTLQYPIHIDIDLSTDIVTVSQDTTTPNPIYALANNILESRTYVNSGITILSIKIPVHQFTRTTAVEDLFPNVPFSKQYTYTSNFYAIRLYVDTVFDGYASILDIDGVTQWTEIHQTLSSSVYDPSVIGPPTAIVSVDTDKKTVTITLPFVYITNNMVGKQLKVELMETEGVIDVDASALNDALIPARFPLTGNADVDIHTQVLTNTNNLNITLINTRIKGGTAGMDFTNLRRRVIYNTFNDQLLVTPMDLIGYFEDNNIGFKVTKFKDGITSRIYLCHKELRDSKSAVIPSGDITTIFNSAAIDNCSTTIKKFVDGTYVALPSAIYKYDEQTNKCTPMTDAEKAVFDGKTPIEKMDILNANTYTFNPYYTRISLANNIPLSNSYNLANPILNTVEFIKSASKTDAQLSIYHTEISFDNTTGDYILTVEVKISGIKDKSTSIPTPFTKDNIAQDDIVVVVCTKDADNRKVYHRNITQSVDPVKYDTAEFTTLENSLIGKFVIRLNTDYHIFGNDLININFLNNPFSKIPLTCDLELSCFIKDEYDASGTNASIVDRVQVLAGNVLSGYHPLTITNINTRLGHQLPELFNAVDIVFDKNVIATYDEPVYEYYTSDVYEKAANGVFSFSIVDDQVVLNKIHSTGRIKYSSTTKEMANVDILGFIDNLTLTSVNKATYVGNYRVLQSDGLHALDEVVSSDPTVLLVDTLLDTKVTLVPNVITLTSANVSDYLGCFIVNMTNYPVGGGVDILIDQNYVDTFTDPVVGVTIGVPEERHSVGDPIISTDDGVTIVPVIQSRAINYYVSMIHVNQRMLYGDLNAYGNYASRSEYINNIRTVIDEYCKVIKSSKDRLLPNTEIYFRPSRSIGVANFTSSSADITSFNLETSIAIKLFVIRRVIGDQELQDSIRATIINIVDDCTTKPVFSLTDVADNILSKLNNVVVSVDIKGIAGDQDMQTLIPIDEGVILNLRHNLVENNGVVDIDRDITLSFVVSN